MRTAKAPAKGCRKPQARFCTAMASVNWDTEIPMSWVRAGMNTPRLCRKPMLTDSISAAPIKMGKPGRSAIRRFMVCHSLC